MHPVGQKPPGPHGSGRGDKKNAKICGESMRGTNSFKFLLLFLTG